MGQLIHFNLSADFGFFKKPDINKFSLTYNLPPKPAVLGILGSILGMKGLNQHYEENLEFEELQEIGEVLVRDYKKSKRLTKNLNFELVKEGLERLNFKDKEELLLLLGMLKALNEKEFEAAKKERFQRIILSLSLEPQYPEYYKKLKHLKIGIKPIGDFPFNKIINKYNSKNSYFGGAKYDNIIISEQLLIKPKYHIYVYEEGNADVVGELFTRLRINAPIFMPYLGKNEFIANFDDIKIIENISPLVPEAKNRVSSIFIRTENISDEELSEGWEMPKLGGTRVIVRGLPQGFIFIEHYPTGYLNEGMQYTIQLAEYTARTVEKSRIDFVKSDLFRINDELIYLF